MPRTYWHSLIIWHSCWPHFLDFYFKLKMGHVEQLLSSHCKDYSTCWEWLLSYSVHAAECQLHYASFWLTIFTLLFPMSWFLFPYWLSHTSLNTRLPRVSIALCLSTFYMADLFQLAHSSVYSLSTKFQFVWGFLKSLLFFFFLTEQVFHILLKKEKSNLRDDLCRVSSFSLCLLSLCLSSFSLLVLWRS